MGRAGRVLVWIFTLAASGLSGQVTPRPPLTPGAVALLANQSASENTEPLRQALLDPDPRVRAVAARVAGVGGRADLWKEMMGALAREQDTVTGAELVRAVLYAAGPGAIDVIKAQARRFGGTPAIVFAEWLARMQPDRFIDMLSELVSAAGPDSGRLAWVIATAVVQHPSKGDSLRRAWMPYASDGTWRPLLDDTLLAAGAETDARILEDALKSDRASVREETLWFVVNALAGNQHVPEGVLDAALPRDVAGLSSWESLGRELIARRRRKIAATEASDAIKAEWPRHSGDMFDLATLPELTPAERTALTELTAEKPSARPPRSTGPPSLRTLPAITPGVISSTLERAGCRAKGENNLGLALVTFRPDGRPMRIEIAESGLTTQCKAAFTALARLAVADTDYGTIESPQDVVLPMTPGFLACASEAPPLSVPRERVGGTIKTPRKLRDVKPVYPPAAIQKRIQGAVLIDARIAPSGCIASARIIHSIPGLDIVALRAVLDWKYEPALLDGQPVPVFMTMTVNFTLQ